MNWEILLEYKRAGLSESRKFGALCWTHGRKKVHLCGSDFEFYGRSSSKPFHMKSIAKELHSLLTWEEKALSIASHNAEAMHLETLNGILKIEEQHYLQVPASMPLRVDPLFHKRPEHIYHPCSGEHAAILCASKFSNWGLKDYTSLEHPFQKSYEKYLRSHLGASWKAKYTAKDGCGLPTCSFTLTEMSLLYANLVKEKDSDWIWEAMVRNPQLVGGTGRLDTAIMQACEGKVIAKEGADGLLGMSVIHSEYPEGLGIVIKLAHGSDPQAMWHIASGILASLGWTLQEGTKLIRQRAVLNSKLVPETFKIPFEKFQEHKLREMVDDTY